MMMALVPAPCTTLTGQDTVTRGQSATFSLSNLPASPSISNWKFIGSAGGVVNRTTNTSATSWTGIMVASGTVSVIVNGQSYSKSITVNPRSNFAFTAVNAEQRTNCPDADFPSLCSYVTPPQSGGDLGRYETKMPYSYTLAPQINDNGPNHRYWYIASVTPVSNGITTRFVWSLHAELNNTGSAFYLAQCGSNGYISGAKLKSNTIFHESGSSVNANSHYGKYRDAQNDPNNNMGLVGEAVVGTPGTSGSAYETLINTAIINARNTIVAATNVEPCGGYTNYDASNGCVNNGNINYMIGGAYANCGPSCVVLCGIAVSQCMEQIEQCASNCVDTIISQYPVCLYNPSPCMPMYSSCLENCHDTVQSECTNQYSQCLAGCQ